MSNVEPQLLQATQAVLRPGEQIEYLGVLSHCIPKVAVFLPLIARLYAGHFLVAVTSERLIFFPTSFGLLGGVNAPSGQPTCIELADAERVESFNPVVPYGHQAVRLTLRQGLVHELMYTASRRGLDAHSAFAVGFAGSIARRVDARAVAPRADAEHNVVPFKPRPAVFTFLLLLLGSLLSVGAFFPLFLMVLGAPFETLLLALTMLFVGLPMLAAGIFLRRQRAAQMGVAQTPIVEILSNNRKRIAIGCGVIGVPLVLGGGILATLLAIDAYRRDQAEAEYRAAAQSRAAADLALAEEIARFPARGADAPAVPSTFSYRLVGPVPPLQRAQQRLEAAGFHVQAAATPLGWELTASGDAGQVIRLSALDATSRGESDVTRGHFEYERGTNNMVYEVRGPDAEVRRRFLQNITDRVGDCYFNSGVPACVAPMRGRVTSALGAMPVVFEVARQRYEVRIFTPPAERTTLSNESGWLAGATTAPESSDYGRGQHRASDWTRWVFYEVTRP